MLDSLQRSRRPYAAVRARLRRGESIDGFGHPLYRGGDPRAIALLDMLREGYAKSRELAFVLEVADAAASVTRERPNLDFALASPTRVLRLPAGSPLTIFAIGRTIGWIGHAIEQYATGQLIRPRAKYVGVTPGSLRRLALDVWRRAFRPAEQRTDSIEGGSEDALYSCRNPTRGSTRRRSRCRAPPSRQRPGARCITNTAGAEHGGREAEQRGPTVYSGTKEMS